MVLLNKVIPSYAKSLFQDKHIARKIKLVELIGFASPTYQGMYIGDNYNTDLGRDSIHFNMDLSYKRARSIFKYVFDKRKIEFPYQENLLKRAKVSSRSHLLHTKRTTPIRTDFRQYCKTQGCKIDQKVMLKFYLTQ